MLVYKNRRANTDNPGLTDNTNIRHIIVFSDSAVFSFITFILFYEKYPNIQLIIINRRTCEITA